MPYLHTILYSLEQKTDQSSCILIRHFLRDFFLEEFKIPYLI